MKPSSILPIALCSLMCASEISRKYDAAENPITITASISGRFQKGYPWKISVNSAGAAHIIIDARGERKSIEARINEKQLQEFASAIDKENFFAMKDQYGVFVESGSVRYITITKGVKTKTILIAYIDPAIDHKLARDAGAILKIHNLVRKWVDDADAVNLEKYDEPIIRATENAG